MRKGTISLLLSVSIALSGCATWKAKVARFEEESYAKRCERAGYPPTSPLHVECIANTKRADQESNKQNVALGVAAFAITQAAQPQPVHPSSPIYNTPSRGSSPGARIMLCPDGSYVNGSVCQLAPNGRYVGGPVTLAPDGTYVTGRPQLTPDGSYVGGSGSTTLCPDGTYVAGGRCVLTPSGSYVGAP